MQVLQLFFSISRTASCWQWASLAPERVTVLSRTWLAFENLVESSKQPSIEFRFYMSSRLPIIPNFMEYTSLPGSIPEFVLFSYHVSSQCCSRLQLQSGLAFVVTALGLLSVSFFRCKLSLRIHLPSEFSAGLKISLGVRRTPESSAATQTTRVVD